MKKVVSSIGQSLKEEKNNDLYKTQNIYCLNQNVSHKGSKPNPTFPQEKHPLEQIKSV